MNFKPKISFAPLCHLKSGAPHPTPPPPKKKKQVLTKLFIDRRMWHLKIEKNLVSLSSHQYLSKQ